MTTTIDDLLARIETLPADQQAAFAKDAQAFIKQTKWFPSPGPQSDAYFCDADVLLYGGQGGGGKALALDTLIVTPDGWTTMRDIRVGDSVYDKDGQACRVTAVSPVMIGRPCFRVQFADGPSIVADADHQWVTRTIAERMATACRTPEWRARRRAKRPSRAGMGVRLRPDVTAKNRAKEHEYVPPPDYGVRTTTEIAATLQRGGRRDFNHAVPVSGAIQGDDRTVAIDPYLLGAWLGDGKSSGARMTMAEGQMVAEVSAAAGGGHQWRVVKGAQLYDYGVTGGFLVALRGYGLLNNKHIPPVYLRASFAQRLALLQGLMDTDGFVKPSGNCEFTTTTPALRDGMIELLATLGVKAGLSTGRAMLKGKDCGEKYRIKFTTPLPAFRLTRKLDRAANAAHRATIRQRYITAVDPVPSVPVKCISVDSSSRTYLCGREMIPTHNSDLLLGLAFTQHRRSLIMRRRYVNLNAMTDRLIEINGSREGFNGSPPPKLVTADGRSIEFGAAQHLGDEMGWQGQPHDLLGMDEATQFLEGQVRFLLGWLRSTTPGQRVRAVLATNPPVSAEGDWIIGMFRPWLDVTHAKPAKVGEIRWFATAPDGKDIEVDGPALVEFPGNHKPVTPMSRTFIPAALRDNPYLVNTGYQAKLDNLPEPIRSAVRDGNFMAARADDEFQVIPTEWIIDAQARWTPQGRDGRAMTACALDVAAGGDETVLAMRYGGWYAPLVAMSGEKAKDPSHAAAMVVANRRDRAPVVIDVDGGWGGASLQLFNENGIAYLPFKGSAPSKARTNDGQLQFVNKRAEAWWRMREALSPDQEGGSPVALPPDPQLRADLAAPTWEMTVRGVKIEDKGEIKKRIGRSPDRGDAVVMCLSEGNAAVKRERSNNGGREPTVNLSRPQIRRHR